MSKDNGGPAFPTEGGRTVMSGNTMHKTLPSDGMTLRDYFAAKASDGDVSAIMAEHMVSEDFGTIVISHCSITRQQARYMHADAMLLERAK